MKRKVLSVMLATAMTATLFAGCGSDASNADSANSADATASTTEAGDAKTDAAASGSGSVYYLNFKPEQESAVAGSGSKIHSRDRNRGYSYHGCRWYI